VVVGLAGSVSRWVMPLSRQIFLEEYFSALAEAIGELFAVVR
jgi:hypothetical protein